jgi:predicted DsbA family dithiol-disulfide isomerase
LREHYDIEVTWRPFELHPETPIGGRAVAQLFPPSQLRAMRGRLEQFANELGVEMGWPEHLPNTRRALAAAEYARDQERFEAFWNAAMDAHWNQGRNLEDDDDLRAVAITAGLDPRATLEASTDAGFDRRIRELFYEGMDRGVTGIPTWFIGRQRVVGAQPSSELAKVVERAGGRPRPAPPSAGI